MAEWTREINTNYNFPNINILNVLEDGVLSRYEAVPQEGYVMYDTQAEDYIVDPETTELVPVTYYSTLVGMPKTFDFDNFTWVAVLRSTVDENYIFGGGDDEPKPEVM